MERISTYQLFSLTLLFQIGTTVIFAFAASAGRDAWISVLLSTAIGLLIVAGVVVLARLHPGLTLVEWYPKTFGKWIGTPIAWLYPWLFIYNVARIISDIQFLIPETLLPQTPAFIIIFMFLALTAYGLYHGIEVLGRLAGYMLPIIFIMFLIETILIFGSGEYTMGNLLPIAGEGFDSIWKAVWPTGVTQSYGEILVMGMIWPLVKDQKGIMKVSLSTTLVAGIFIAFADILAIIVLDEVIFERSFYPLYVLLRQIGVGEFLENLDVFAVIYFVVTAFFKAVIYIFAAVRSIQLLTHMQSSRKLILPVTCLVFFVGVTMADNIVEHIMGVHMTILSPYLWIPMLFILPGLLLIAALIRKQLNQTL